MSRRNGWRCEQTSRGLLALAIVALTACNAKDEDAAAPIEASSSDVSPSSAASAEAPPIDRPLTTPPTTVGRRADPLGAVALPEMRSCVADCQAAGSPAESCRARCGTECEASCGDQAVGPSAKEDCVEDCRRQIAATVE